MWQISCLLWLWPWYGLLCGNIDEMLKQIHEAGKHENSISGKKNKIGGLIFGCIFPLILASAAMMATASVSMVIGWIGPALFLVCILIQKEVLPLKKNISIRRQKYDWDDAGCLQNLFG